jgi:hypothetical protein
MAEQYRYNKWYNLLVMALFHTSKSDFLSTAFKIISIKYIMQGPFRDTNGHYSSTEKICFLWYLKVHSCIHTLLSWLCILSQTNLIQTLPIFYLKSLISMLPAAHRSPKWSIQFSLRFHVQIFVCISLSHMCATWPTHINLPEVITLLHNMANLHTVYIHV